jgi:hypothetical protein
MSDSYTVKQASLALGVTEKRVRQLITEGKLEQVGKDPVTVSSIQVLELRQKRENSAKVIQARGKKQDYFREMFSAVEQLVKQTNENQQKLISTIEESHARNEENYLRQIAELKAENEKLRAETVRPKRRGFFNK